MRRAEGYGKDLMVAGFDLLMASPIVNAEGKSRCTTQDASSPCKVLQHLEEVGKMRMCNIDWLVALER